MAYVERFSISMNRELLKKFDERIRRKGYPNRSEAIRDLVRNALVEQCWGRAGEKVAATVTLVYDHHTRELADRLADIQHDHGSLVVATTHVHLDDDNCLEVVILRGRSGRVRRLAELLIAQKGVKHGRVIHTSEGRDLW
ncbi:nickel-responsive regulator [candidate division BRC1 bacterium SM23_51]|nr:MAG: nickel-responsive regulator [candidate division BRC1 bacterium SM23_51]